MTPRPTRWATLSLAAVLVLGVGACGDTDAGSTTTSQRPAPETTDAAIARFEQYLHALGEGDMDTLCEIGPVTQSFEDEGFDCDQLYDTVLMAFSTEQSEALSAATVDPDAIDTTSSGKVVVPVDAVVSPVTFAPEELGTYTLGYQDDNWYVDLDA